MKRRIIAAVLAFCILLVCAPVPTTAADDSIGKYAVPNSDVTSFFVYNEDTGEKLEPYRVGNLLAIGKPFVNTITTYRYNCMSGGTIARIG